MLEFNFPRSEKERNSKDLVFFRKKVHMKGKITPPQNQTQNVERINEFLRRNKFRKIKNDNGNFSAIRGHSFWRYIGMCDPRKILHSLEINQNGKEISYHITIEMGFLILGTAGDVNVFECEMEILQNLLNTGEWDNSPLTQLNALRKKTESFYSYLFLVIGIAVCLKLGLGIFFAMFLNHWLGNLGI